MLEVKTKEEEEEKVKFGLGWSLCFQALLGRSSRGERERATTPGIMATKVIYFLPLGTHNKGKN